MLNTRILMLILVIVLVSISCGGDNEISSRFGDDSGISLLLEDASTDTTDISTDIPPSHPIDDVGIETDTNTNDTNSSIEDVEIPDSSIEDINVDELDATHEDVDTTDNEIPDVGTTDVGTTDGNTNDNAQDANIVDTSIPDVDLPDANITDILDADITDIGVTDTDIPDADTTDIGITDTDISDADTTDIGSTDPNTTLPQTYQAEERATFRISSQLSFITASGAAQNMLMPRSSVERIVREEMQNFRLYVVGNVVRVFQPHRYYSGAILRPENDSWIFEYHHRDPNVEDQFSALINGNQAQIRYSHAFGASVGTEPLPTISYTSFVTAFFTAEIERIPDDSTAPLPAYGLWTGIMSDHGVVLKWVDENNDSTDLVYEIYRDRSFIGTSNIKEYRDHSIRTNHNIITCPGSCFASYQVLTRSPSGTTDGLGEWLMVYLGDGSSNRYPCLLYPCPTGFTCFTSGACHENNQ